MDSRIERTTIAVSPISIPRESPTASDEEIAVRELLVVRRDDYTYGAHELTRRGECIEVCL
jgi:hypothetical protein